MTVDPSILRTNLRAHWRDPGWWRHVALPFAVRTALVQPYFAARGNREGVDVMAEEWDNLVILDACRYDMFAEHNPFDVPLQSRRSKGSNTAEFLQRNFAGKTFRDTVYVTANPQVDVNLEDVFHETVSVWRDRWDPEFDTVMPGPMAEATLAAAAKHPHKRIISHFVQPHYPFVGDVGRSLVPDQAGIELSKRQARGETAESDHANVWDLLKRGVLRTEDVWAAYEENLEVVLPHVVRLVEELSGLSVVSSDHGNLVGERPGPCPLPGGMFGHPPGVYAEELVRVPWLVVPGTERRDVREGQARDAAATTESGDAAERLRALGYR